ncbi:hypothetical protein HYN48_14265 [Flavobacterium magnum]|uniref:Uncharacterized protein n=1 Tax=Flavobacterium magnum TaxID=2162713 RepID=A0A2S0RHE0_9FLAO|nr:hypothetical protein [Flavobacterium magnum]AWA31163.1 hypothetical protein HYN48_14265 [Flavobacterium magnum]
MKFTIYLFVFFSSIYGFAQNQREILLVSTSFYNQKCKNVAFRVNQKQIQIDNCYDSETNEFNITTTIDIKSEKVVQQIYKMSTEDLKYYESQIDSTKNCDAIKPIKIFVFERGVKTEIEWSGIQNCYPKSVKKIVESLEQLFIKYKLE